MRLRALAVAVLFAGCTFPPAEDAPAASIDEPPADAAPLSPDELDAHADAGPAASATDARAPEPPRVETLTRPAGLAPSEGERVDHRGVTFTWTPAVSSLGSLVTYTLILNDRDACTALRETRCTLDVDEGETHAWAVKATTSTGLSTFSSLEEFRANALPTIARPEYPPAGSRTWSLGDEFHVAPSTDADGDALTTHVHVQRVGQTRALLCEPRRDACAPSAPLTPGAEYEWWTTTTDGLATVTSPRVAFRTNLPPDVPRLSYPPEDSHEWMPGDTFRVTGQSDPDGDTVTIFIHYRQLPRGSWRTCEPGDDCELAQGAAYEWYASATDGKLLVETPTETFRTNAPPLPLLAPRWLDGADQVPLDITIDLDHPGDPDRDTSTYTFIIRDDEGRRVNSCFDLDVPICTVSLPRHGTTYTVTATAVDEHGLASEDTEWSFTTRRPIVLLHGWNGDDRGWGDIEDAFSGYELIKIRYTPTQAHQSITAIARSIVAPAVASRVDGRPFDVIAHSMGGLISRVLVEGYPHATGQRWEGDVHTVVMLGTPNEGAPMAEWCGASGFIASAEWKASACEMDPGSAFFRTMNPAFGTRVRYHTIAGDWGWGEDDGLVSTESVSIGRAISNTVVDGACHSTAIVDCDQHEDLLHHDSVVAALRALFD